MKICLLVCLALVALTFAEPPVPGYLPPSQQYGPPSQQYGPPQQQQQQQRFSAPPSQQYGAPQEQYRAPSAPSAPSAKYGAPSGNGNGYRQNGNGFGQRNGFGSNGFKSNGNGFGARAPSTAYGTPSLTTAIIKPNPSYEAPRQAPSNAYLPPGAGGNGNGYGRGGYEDEQSEPANYEFEYMVEDASYGVDFGHREQRQDDFTQGRYYVVLPDGRKQIVEYEADANGYRPKISYEEGFGNGNGNGRGGYPRGPANGNGYQDNGYSQNGGARNGNGNGYAQNGGYNY